ncbi:hypothetical protein [Ruania alba]|uniref:hypothetical protein n=1 Tax=Ruania alba TaxID=648782 RepID=UPI0015873DB5|nr:hypothetical protein [Ruania alba]
MDEQHAAGGEESVQAWQRRYWTSLGADEGSEVVLERIALVFPQVAEATGQVHQYT